MNELLSHLSSALRMQIVRPSPPYLFMQVRRFHSLSAGANLR
jgi:hypothetical protein